MAKQKLEKEIQAEIMAFLRMVSIHCWVQKTIGTYDMAKGAYRRASPYSIRGVSDILGIVQGRMLAIEVKSATGTLSPEQRIFLAKINQEGGIAFVARSVEQAAESLCKHFPNNVNFRRFCKEYVDQGSTSDH